MRRSPPSATMRSARQMRCESSWRLQTAQPALVAAGLTRNKRPRGRAPAGYCWDEQKGGWFDENGKPFELVDHPSRQRLRAQKRTAALEACTIPWKADLLLHHEKERREPRQAVLREREAHLAHLREANAEAKAEGLLWESLAVEERQRRCKAVR